MNKIKAAGEGAAKNDNGLLDGLKKLFSESGRAKTVNCFLNFRRQIFCVEPLIFYSVFTLVGSARPAS